MKVVIAGVTGFIGGEVLNQCIRNPNITRIYTLSRRALPATLLKYAKVTPIILENFLSYPADVLEQLTGVEVCLWTIGVKQNAPLATLMEIEVGYSQAAAKAFTERLQPLLPEGKKFRFVHLSGVLAEKDSTRTLWFLGDGRRAKGEAELEMLKFARQNDKVFGAFIVRPGMVLSGASFLPRSVFWEWLWPSAFIGVEHLALCMISLANEAGSGTIENATAIEKGRKAALAKSS